MKLFPHQVEPYAELRRTAEGFFFGAWQGLPVRPRFTRLIAGSSGTGKTYLARRLAEDLGVAYLELSVTNWLPLGASDRGARPTWLDIADFCHANPVGIVLLDEIDKCGQNTPWMTFLRVEMFSLLDHRIVSNLNWQPRDEEFANVDAKQARSLIANRLRDRILVLGAGAFQDLWSLQRASAGFHAAKESSRSLPHRRITEVLPLEIVNRFVPPLILMPPLVQTDYRALLDSLCRRLPKHLRTRLRALAARSIHEAASQNLGARWAEQLLLEVVTQRQRRVSREEVSRLLHPEEEEVSSDLAPDTEVAPE